MCCFYVKSWLCIDSAVEKCGAHLFVDVKLVTYPSKSYRHGPEHES